MIYLLKFGASLLMPPGIFLICFFIIACIIWRRGHSAIAKFMVGLNIVFYLLSTQWISSILIGSLEAQCPSPDTMEGDCIVMLGGGASAGTPAVQGTGNLSCVAESRLTTAAQLYRLKPLPIIVSGGQVYADSGSEANIAKRDLGLLGVPPEMIIVEDKSLNTRQNAVNTCEIMKKQGWSRPILVTSAFHMDRAVLNFQKEGIEPIPFATDYRVSQPRYFHWNKLSPSAQALEDSELFLKEKLRIFVTRYFE
ncbi:MAG: YdcF family protein [Anaerovibrio sp.]|uniref:YdcF family protein n=1 Tax=Anaerovibrio sp. TaxID=1872532 RepID=UPI0025D6A1F2|nr:YdcF family protein [Anaerovibrio sp.]MCR5176542.1 YdcF family protein [Anaerovibrio sp.]